MGAPRPLHARASVRLTRLPRCHSRGAICMANRGRLSAGRRFLPLDGRRAVPLPKVTEVTEVTVTVGAGKRAGDGAGAGNGRDAQSEAVRKALEPNVRVRSAVIERGGQQWLRPIVDFIIVIIVVVLFSPRAAHPLLIPCSPPVVAHTLAGHRGQRDPDRLAGAVWFVGGAPRLRFPVGAEPGAAV